jgi:hypothetical protein
MRRKPSLSPEAAGIGALPLALPPRAQSMKSCATGVTVRFFNVMIPTTPPFAARLIGRTLMERSQPPNLRTDSEAIERKCPFATRAIRAIPVAVTMAGRGSSSPIARNTSVSNL